MGAVAQRTLPLAQHLADNTIGCLGVRLSNFEGLNVIFINKMFIDLLEAYHKYGRVTGICSICQRKSVRTTHHTAKI